MICPSCRAQIDDGVNECGYCGYSFIPRHSRRLNDNPSKIDYDLKEYMQKHLEKNGNGNGGSGSETQEDTPYTTEQRRIVAPPPAGAAMASANTMRIGTESSHSSYNDNVSGGDRDTGSGYHSYSPNRQPERNSLQADISSQRHLPHISPSNNTVLNEYDNKDNTTLANNQDKDKRITHGYRSPEELAQPPVSGANSMVVGASDIRKRTAKPVRHNELKPGRQPERRPTPHPPSNQPQQAQKRPLSSMSNREIAEQLVNQVMEKPFKPANEAGQRQHWPEPPSGEIKYEQQTWPERPAAELTQAGMTARADGFERPYQAPQRPRQQHRAPEEPQPDFLPPREDAFAGESAHHPDAQPSQARGVEYIPQQRDYKPVPPKQQRQTIDRPSFDDYAPYGDTASAEATGNMRPNTYNRYAPQPEFDEVDKGMLGRASIERAEEYEPEQFLEEPFAGDNELEPEARPYAEPISTPEVYQSETYFAADSDIYRDEPIEPSGDEGVEDGVPETFDPDADKLGFMPMGDEGSVDDLPEEFLRSGDEMPAGYIEDDYVDSEALGNTDIPDPDTFIPDDGTMLPDMDGMDPINSIIDEDIMAEDLAREQSMFEDRPSMTMAEAAEAVVKDGRRNSPMFDNDTDSDEAPTQPVSRTFHESKLSKNPPKKKSSMKPLAFGLGLVLIVAIGYSLNVWISRSYGSFDAMLNSFFGGGENTVDVEEIDHNGSAAHRITLRTGVEGTLVLESVEEKLVPIVGGVASAIITDSYWVDYAPAANETERSVELRMYIQDKEGKQIPLETKTFTVQIPITDVDIEWENAELSTAKEKFNVVIAVEPNTKVYINSEDVSNSIIDGRRLDHDIYLDEGENKVTIVVQTRHKRPFEQQYVIKRTSSGNAPSSLEPLPTVSGDVVDTSPSAVPQGNPDNANDPVPDA